MTTKLLIVILMVILSACFSASESAFNAANKMRLKKSAESGNKAAGVAYRISENFTSALSAILIGNNLVNIAASTTATVLTMDLLLHWDAIGNKDSVASLISTVVMTIVVLIFGEILPKIIARNNANALVQVAAYPIRILTWVLFPVVWVVLKLIGLLSKIWGKDSEDAPTVTEEELSSIIETVEEEGVIDEEKGELLQSTLDFRTTTVEEIMTPRIDMLTFEISADPEKIEQLIDESRYSRIPVYEESIDNIIGILYLNQYYRRITEAHASAPLELRELLIAPCLIHKTMKLPAALALLRERKTHLAIVIDEYGGTMGLVTMEDILEELVGDIWDESDEIITEFTQTSETTYEVSGDMNIDDFFSEIEFEPNEFSCEYSTMGGWAIEMLNASPHVGDSFAFFDRPLDEEDDPDAEEGATELFIVVSEMDEMRVTKLTVLIKHHVKNDEDEE